MVTVVLAFAEQPVDALVAVTVYAPALAGCTRDKTGFCRLLLKFNGPVQA